MSIDEMIEALEYGPMDYGPDDDRVLIPIKTAEKISRALRAGQAMRDNVFDATKEWKLDEALKAWDAATREESV